MNTHVSKTGLAPTRRNFLAGAGLVIGVAIAPKSLIAAPAVEQGAPAGGTGDLTALNAFVKIAPDDTVTILSKHIEFGQGPYTGLATIVAEELDADWAQMRAEASPADDNLYKNLAFGIQGTGGSSSIANSYEQMRQAGATARAMLVAAAAAEWGVPASEITVEKGRIRHAASGKESGFGALADKAATMPAPDKVTLKDPKDFTLIGKERHKLDTAAKSTGKAVFTIDVLADGMITAMVKHPDHFGAKVKSFDDTEARKVAGVIDVKAVPQGVAVYAENTFAALKGRDALTIEWDLSQAETRSSAEIMADYRKQLDDRKLAATARGDVEKAFASDGATLHEAEFTFPFLAHAPMEPLDAVFVPGDDGLTDIYSGAQFPTGDVKAAAEALGVDPAKVRMNVQYAGGSFGRRAQFGSPYMQEAAAVFAASDRKRPLKHLWTREDDIRGGWYRPIYVHRLKGAIDKDGQIAAWDQSVVGQSIMQQEAKLDGTSVEGAADMPYAIANLRVTGVNARNGVPVLWWRSVGHTHTAFTTEVFIDELLEKAGKDPVEGRLAMLADAPRDAAVLKRVAEMADWGSTVPDGRARGVAVHKSFDTYVAEIAEVSIGDDGTPKVHKVWCAVDCGVAINPNIIQAQMEGGIGFGLGAILFDEVTLGAGGRILQSNFHDYRSLRIHEMPQVEVSVIASSEKPTGVGEPGTPPIGPALANGLRKLTGKPIRDLPIVKPQVAA